MQHSDSASIVVRPLRASDLDAADRTIRLAFGTFLGLEKPGAFMGDADYARSRWAADPTAAFAAEVDGSFAGSNFATHWGSVGFFGPLTVHPELWDRKLGSRLMEPVIERFEQWGVDHAGLYTFAQSQKHVGLYRKFGFWPRFLTAILSKPLVTAAAVSGWSRFSALDAAARTSVLADCRALTDACYEGLDVSREIRAVLAQNLGETLLLWDDSGLAGLAVCHAGAGSEAGSGRCYIKFGAVRPDAETDFLRLLATSEALAAQLGATRLVAGVNTARHEAYRLMLAAGFHTDVQGVAMHRGNAPGYNRPGNFLIDDWR